MLESPSKISHLRVVKCAGYDKRVSIRSHYDELAGTAVRTGQDAGSVHRFVLDRSGFLYKLQCPAGVAG